MQEFNCRSATEEGCGDTVGCWTWDVYLDKYLILAIITRNLTHFRKKKKTGKRKEKREKNLSLSSQFV